MRLVDSFKHQGLRKALIGQLREKGGVDEAVLEAMMQVPRHYFMDSTFLNFAYQDKAFPIDAGQTISQPYTVGIQTTLLDLQERDKVLEIGTGSGYQTSVLHRLGARVFSIERQKTLFKNTKKLLEQMNVTARLFYGDGYKGLPAFAPFDKILITCGAPVVPQALLDQLRPGGIMVIPVGDLQVQRMLKLKKNDDGSLETTEHGDFAFVPMLEDKK